MKSNRIRVKAHVRKRNGRDVYVKKHFRVLRQAPIQRSERLIRARKEGFEAERAARIMFENQGFETINTSSATKGMGDILVTNKTGNKWLIEVKKINEWEYISLTSRRRGRIQVNRTEHYAMLRNAKGMDATPVYLVFVQHDSGIMTKRFISPKKVTKYVKNKQFHEVKIPFSLITSEEFSIEKFKN